MIKREKCTGCFACYNICKQGAIEMYPDEEGFKYPHINHSLCNKCGKCTSVCPSITPYTKKENKPLHVYAAWSLNYEIRSASTSGGIFSELAMEIINEEGYICGAVYNSDLLVEHFIAKDVEGLERIRQSKYVQSDINFAYREISELLLKGRKVLFCGSPCECAGLKKYLEINGYGQDNLFVVDFICRGANSPKVYKKYLMELEKKYSSEIKKVWFKNKTYGWNRFCTKIEFENGQNYLEDRYHDMYIRGYIEENLYIRPSCSECIYKELPLIADITLADFWGVNLRDNKDTDGGTSLVVINSKKGEELFNRIKSRIFMEGKCIEDAVPGNMCIYHSIIHGVNRNKFMKDLDSMNIMENLKRFLK